MKTVLYVDDEADTEKMSSKFELMKAEGITVIPATRIKMALDELEMRRASIDLVILDIIMPPEDYYSLEDTEGGTTTGLKLLEEIRRKYSDLPIIIVSVRRSPGVQKFEAMYNVADFLEKPVSAFTLAAAIKRITN
ncbi:MAG TPA: response regulator [Pyrinomonadaceae bacterium]|jgi:CheY-like chemotaxis protein